MTVTIWSRNSRWYLSLVVCRCSDWVPWGWRFGPLHDVGRSQRAHSDDQPAAFQNRHLGVRDSREPKNTAQTQAQQVRIYPWGKLPACLSRRIRKLEAYATVHSQAGSLRHGDIRKLEAYATDSQAGSLRHRLASWKLTPRYSQAGSLRHGTKPIVGHPKGREISRHSPEFRWSSWLMDGAMTNRTGASEKTRAHLKTDFGALLQLAIHSISIHLTSHGPIRSGTSPRSSDRPK